METIAYRLEQEIPVIRTVDVCVVGGGPGGLGAAVMAARQGAKTLLVERFSGLGGMAWSGEVSPFMPNHADGKSLDRPIYQEWRKAMLPYSVSGKQLDPNGQADWEYCCRINKDAAMLAAEDLCLDAGVQLLYHHTLFDVIKADKRIVAAVFHSKAGLVAVKAKNFIDSTGDADLAAMAGCKYEFGNADGFCQPMTLCFKLAHVDRKLMPSSEEITKLYLKAKEEGEVVCPREDVLWFTTHEDDIIHFNSTRVIKKSALNGQDLSEAEIEARRQLRQLVAFLRRRVAGFENAVIHSIGSHIGVRESRRVRCKEFLTSDAFEKLQKFPDAIAKVSYPIDIHNPSGTGTILKFVPQGEWYEIPYGCIVASDCDNLLVGSRSISVDHALHSSMRVMPPVCSIGQAAGMAAAMAAAANIKPADLDGKEVRRKLAAVGANL